MDTPLRPALIFILFGLPIIACVDRSPVSPTSGATALTLSPQKPSAQGLVERPLEGKCTTSFSPIDPSSAGVCAVFERAPSAFIAISGQCQITHLGRTELESIQQLLFQLNDLGQPVIIGGQPVVSALRNCSTLTAANGDALRHTTTGDVTLGGVPGEVAFEGTLTFGGGSGRFSSASGSAAFSGTASLITNTGAFSMDGSLVY